MKRNSTFIRFLKLLGKALPLFLFAMVIHMVGDNFLYLTLSYFVNKLTDMAQAGNMNGFWNLVSGCVLANIIALTVFFVFGAVYDIYAKKGNSYVQKMMIQKMLKLPMRYFDEHHSGEIVSRLMNDADTASQIFTSRLRRVTTPLMSVIVYIIPMIIMCPSLAACIVLINIVSLIVNTRYIPKMKRAGKDISKAKSGLTESFLDIVNGRDYIKIYSGAKLLVARYNEKNEENVRANKKYWDNVAKLDCLNTFFDMVCALGFLTVSLIFIGHGWCSAGEVAAIYTLYGTFSYNFLELGKYFPELMNCITRAEVVFNFMDEAEENVGHLDNTDTEDFFLAGNIEFSNITFAYEEKPVMKKMNVVFEENKSTAIVGETGCGKSTLIKLLLGFYPLQEGKICIGGRDINSISLETLRKNLTYVPQNIFLFRETIRENIRYGNLKATDKEIVEAAKLANAHDFIMKLPEGYNTKLNDRGRNLSGGERQRIALARAFVRKAPIILMDEATSALDNSNENEIQLAVKQLISDRTALVVAHRKMTIAACNRKFEMV